MIEPCTVIFQAHISAADEEGLHGLIPPAWPNTCCLRPAAWLAALLLALVCLPGCSNFAAPNDTMPTSGTAVPYVKLAADHFKAAFKPLPPVNTFEISGLRWVQTGIGWDWLACVRFQDRGHRRTYSVFIKDAAIVNTRYAVQTDGCDSQSYSPFDPQTGTARSASDDVPGPLY
jgi:hypothetical protein